jgi:hypothetical protein
MASRFSEIAPVAKGSAYYVRFTATDQSDDTAVLLGTGTVDIVNPADDVSQVGGTTALVEVGGGVYNATIAGAATSSITLPIGAQLKVVVDFDGGAGLEEKITELTTRRL